MFATDHEHGWLHKWHFVEGRRGSCLQSDHLHASVGETHQRISERPYSAKPSLLDGSCRAASHCGAQWSGGMFTPDDGRCRDGNGRSYDRTKVLRVLDLIERNGQQTSVSYEVLEFEQSQGRGKCNDSLMLHAERDSIKVSGWHPLDFRHALIARKAFESAQTSRLAGIDEDFMKPRLMDADGFTDWLQSDDEAAVAAQTHDRAPVNHGHAMPGTDIAVIPRPRLVESLAQSRLLPKWGP